MKDVELFEKFFILLGIEHPTANQIALMSHFIDGCKQGLLMRQKIFYHTAFHCVKKALHPPTSQAASSKKSGAV